jgi:hypothetical protein
MPAIQSLLSLLGFFADLVIFIVCISYLSKKQTTDSMLLFAGSLIRAAMRIFYLAMPYFSSLYDSGSDNVLNIYTVANAVSLIGAVLFCVGFVILVRGIVSVQPRRHR